MNQNSFHVFVSTWRAIYFNFLFFNEYLFCEKTREIVQ